MEIATEFQSILRALLCHRRALGNQFNLYPLYQLGQGIQPGGSVFPMGHPLATSMSGESVGGELGLEEGILDIGSLEVTS